MNIIFSAPPPEFHSSTATSFYSYKAQMTLRANRKQRFSVIELKAVFYQGIILSDAAVCIICACHFIPIAPSQPYV